MSFSTLITAIEGDKPTFQDVSDILQLAIIGGGNPISLGTFSGSANTYTATSSPSIGAYAAGQLFFGKTNVVNTGGSTLNIDSLGAKTINTFLGAAITAGQLLADATYIFRYDGKDIICLNPSSGTLAYSPTVDKSGTGSTSSTTTSSFARVTPDGRLCTGFVRINTTTTGTIDYLTVTLPATPHATYSNPAFPASANEAGGAAKNIFTIYTGGVVRLYGDVSAVAASWSAGTHNIYVPFHFAVA